MRHRIETVAIGDELLTGRIADTNSAFVGAQLFQNGLRLDATQTVADDPSEIERLLRERSKTANFMVCFGGLGPTSDDRTAKTVADLLGVELVEDPISKEKLIQRVRSRGRELTPQLLKQIVTPSLAQVIPNEVGLAPGFSCRLGKSTLFFLPGVPAEMRPMFLQSVLPRLLSETGARKLLSATWKCLGLPESELQRLMDPIEAALPEGSLLGYRTKFPENHLTLYWRGSAAAFLDFKLKIQALLEPYFYTDCELELEELVVQQLKARGLSLAFAESCTGGLASQRITQVPGSSASFFGGAVVYQARAKSALLGVSVENEAEAVSAKCTLSLAKNLRARSGCDIVAAITGYMGPAGGTASDPIGTVYVAVLGRGEREKQFQVYGLDRHANQWAASTFFLNEVLSVIQSEH
jgi:nicotinamide-nucleotide amidase